jgi:Fe-S cluster biogenesis protein NfuA
VSRGCATQKARNNLSLEGQGALELPSKFATYYSILVCHDRAAAALNEATENAMFIQTEATPNPATLKFLPGRTVLENGTLDLRSSEEAAQSPLAEQLFAIPGVSGVFFGSDFITITKNTGEWQQLKPMILGTIMEHFMSGAPLLTSGSADAAADDEFFDTADAETVATIKELIETRVRPAVANDGGDITFRGFKDGVVYLNMKGACSGCPSSTATLRHGIQNLLRHFVPDVVEVRPM